MREMTPRERVLTAMRREEPDKVPRELSYGSFAPALMNVFREKTGATDPAEYFNYEVRPVAFKPTARRGGFERYLPEKIPEGAYIDWEWGNVIMPGSTYHFVRHIHRALEDATKVEEIEAYPFPDFLEPYRWKHIREEVENLHKRNLASMGELYTTIFEVAWGVRGMENLLTDFLINKDIAKVLLDRITEIRCKQAKIFAQSGVDILRLGDDVGTERGMLMSPETWREWLKPRLKMVIESAKEIKPDILIFYHSDGNCEDIIPDLIEIGVDILNPVQPECMDPAKLKLLYGDKLAFWGTIGTQTTMPFGKPEDVKREVRERIETVGKGGGLLLAPSHILEPEVPWENIIAFFEAIEEYRRYG